MREYRILGSDRIKAEFTREHCRRLAKWFDRKGRFVHFGTEPDSRERLWNSMSLLTHGAKKYRDLARQIILKTPIDNNHFEPSAAVEILLRFRDRLEPKTAAHLKRVVREHFLNAIEVRFGSADSHNFTCMGTWFLLAASQVLDGYKWKHPFRWPPDMYTRARIKEIGMNALYALAYLSEHRPLFTEWNSPTYSPVSLHSMAKIVELIDDPAARELALQIEMKLWREVLSLYHPNLGLSCGPWSRAYRCDMLGQNSQMRILLAYLGISKDRSVAKLFDEKQKDLVFHHDGDIPFVWSGAAWQIAGKFHVPADALAELRNRRFPHRFEAPYRWKDRGPGIIVQVQRENWCLGHSFIVNFHYALAPTVRTMRDVRNVSAAMLFQRTPQEWARDQRGRLMEAYSLGSERHVKVSETERGLAFSAHPHSALPSIFSAELSFNSFIPLHFVPVDAASLNGIRFAGQPVTIRGTRGICRVEDAGFVYEIEYVFSQPVEIRLYRWANFIRFAGFWHKGGRRSFSAEKLKTFALNGRFAILRTPAGNA